jgi:predicted O-methyltransferase YrrM
MNSKLDESMSIQRLKRLIAAAVPEDMHFEGSASDEELQYLSRLSSASDVHLIAEIGFNAGYSSYAFLSSNSHTSVISFDVGEHPYVPIAKKYIDEFFPHRHELITGDSQITVPRYSTDHPSATFDLIFVDGGHDYDIVRADLRNILSFCHQNTTIVIDDLTPWKPWGVGPTKAWGEFLADSPVTQIDLMCNGTDVKHIPSQGGRHDRVWASARYMVIT